MRIWCLLHQLDLWVKKAVQAMFNGEWNDMTFKWSNKLRGIISLTKGISNIPKYTTRWVALVNVLNSLLTNRRAILSHLKANPQLKGANPSDKWWVMSYAVKPALEMIACAVKELQEREMILSFQSERVKKLSRQLSQIYYVTYSSVTITPPFEDERNDEEDEEDNDNRSTGSNQSGEEISEEFNNQIVSDGELIYGDATDSEVTDLEHEATKDLTDENEYVFF